MRKESKGGCGERRRNERESGERQNKEVRKEEKLQ